MTAYRQQMFFRNDLPVNQVLREDGLTNQCLRIIAAKLRIDQISFEDVQISQQPTVDCSLTIDIGNSAPEFTSFHRQTSGETVELCQIGVQKAEVVDTILRCIVRGLWMAKSVV